MSLKSALAKLPYGGAKATLIFSPKIKKHRKQFFVAYAKKINNLKGQFVTGTDIGLENKDIQMMRKYTPYVIGTKVDPAYYTAVGVYYGIKEALKYVFGSPEIEDRTFAVQGLGKTGLQLLKLIYPKAEKIFVTDVDKEKIKKIKQQFPKIKIVSSSAIFGQKVDVFSPCSVGGVLNSRTAANLHCQIVAGSANNQLEGEHIDRLFYKLGILYAPDYVINAGGLISVADEMEKGLPSKKRILRKIVKIPVTLSTIFNISEKRKKPTGLIANQMAEAALKSNLSHF